MASEPGAAGEVADTPLERRRHPRVLPADFRPAPGHDARLEARGKFLFAGPRKVYLRGVTYGTFRPDAQGREFTDAERVASDFAQMAANGFNAVRTYTVPPRWLLDLALRAGLWVMAGVPWEQHVAFLEDSRRARDIEERVRAAVASGAGHPALACYTIGNEIPAPIVRWHGARAVEQFLRRLYRAAKAEDPAALVTYVNFPSTEYLEVPADFLAYNVYLEAQDRLEAYLARVHNLAGDRPVVMAEIGLDSRRHGEEAQARALDWQVRTAFASGCAGAFVFSWTDEWHRGGHDILDWDFGLTDRDRRPKAALAAVRAAFDATPLPATLAWPRVSVVVCSYNGARTIEDTCRGLKALDYPDFEVIVVDDGSTDRTAEIAKGYGFHVIQTPNRGLSAARNTGLREASGSIVAYTDDDAYPDRSWLRYVVAAFLGSDHAAVGGPNIVPSEDPPLAQCVANAPGGPVHVLLDDRVAEHVPGCNMAFRRSALDAIGGFDEQFRTAGDDVDVCWRIQERGWTVGFAPAAMVWHHRRSSLRAYWRQQTGYGKAEALLERKWPEKYNTLGHVTWAGQLYGRGLHRLLGSGRPRVYFGIWGSAPFQRVYAARSDGLLEVTSTPEWHLLTLAMLAMVAWWGWWLPTWLNLGVVGSVLAPPLAHAFLSARQARFGAPPGDAPPGRGRRLGLGVIVALLYLIQPVARLRGRVQHGLTPWRWTKELRGMVAPLPRCASLWSEEWQAAERRLDEIEWWIWEGGAIVHRGGEFESFDLEIRGGIFGRVRLLLASEEHGAGRQLLRVALAPAWSRALSRVAGLLGLLLLGAHGLAVPPLVLGGLWTVAGLTLLRAGQEAALAMGSAVRVLRRLGYAP
jgi:GT2 family glycosyltransferase